MGRGLNCTIWPWQFMVLEQIDFFPQDWKNCFAFHFFIGFHCLSLLDCVPRINKYSHKVCSVSCSLFFIVTKLNAFIQCCFSRENFFVICKEMVSVLLYSIWRNSAMGHSIDWNVMFCCTKAYIWHLGGLIILTKWAYKTDVLIPHRSWIVCHINWSYLIYPLNLIDIK